MALDENKIRIYSDGSCRGNQSDENLGGFGAILEFRDHKKEVKGGMENTTNNVMELLAIIKAFRLIKTDKYTVDVFSDSAYIVNCFSQGWYKKWEKNGFITSNKEPVKNVELWKELIEYNKKFDVKFHKIKGHLDLNAKKTILKKAYAHFLKDKTNKLYTFDDFMYIACMNNKADALATAAASELVRHEGFEPPTNRFEVCDSIRLS